MQQKLARMLSYVRYLLMSVRYPLGSMHLEPWHPLKVIILLQREVAASVALQSPAFSPSTLPHTPFSLPEDISLGLLSQSRVRSRTAGLAAAADWREGH